MEAAVDMFDSEHWIIYTNFIVAAVSLGLAGITLLGLREEHRHQETINDDSQDSEERMAKIALAAIHAEQASHEDPTTSQTK